MKLIISMLILGFSSNIAISAEPITKIQIVINTIEPHIEPSRSLEIAESLEAQTNFYNLDWKIVLAILVQESSLKADPNKCLKHMKKCIDFGIAQINYDTWGKPFKLNKRLLITNTNYSIENMCRILYILKHSHGSGKTWFTRYHSFTKTHRIIYASLVVPRLKLINKLSQNFDKQLKSN